MNNSNGEAVLQVTNLTKIYGREVTLGGRKVGRRVVGAQDVSFSVEKGEIFGFLGPNGAGKTTTMRAILDYLRIQQGSITIFGLDHHQDALLIRERIGHVPGEFALYENFTGNELIEYYGSFRPANQAFLNELKSFFRVDLTLNIKELSTGNRKQVGLILALASKPDFLILDEPTALLDPYMAKKIINLLNEIKNEKNITIIISEHRLDLLLPYTQEIILMKCGSVIEHGNCEKVINGKNFQTLSLNRPVIYSIFNILKNENLYYKNIPASIPEAVRSLK